MYIPQQNTGNIRRKRVKKILWFLFPLLLITSLVLLIAEIRPLIIGFSFLFLSLAAISAIYLMAEKFYNWPMSFIIIFLLGLLFKTQHWPLAGTFLTIGIIFLCLVCLINSVRFQIDFRNNPFLRWFGSVSCIIVSFYMFGLLLRLQHWDVFVSQILGYTGVVMFIISILGMVFTLPGSNYIGWTVTEKRTFFRAILIPMCIVFGLIVITLIFSDLFYFMIKRYSPSWDLTQAIELFDLEGIRK